MTSLFSRLQKLNKEASRVWSTNGAFLSIEGQDRVYDYLIGYPNAELAAECRNSLPAVLNLIEAAQHIEIVHELDRDTTLSAADLTGRHEADCPGCRFSEALAVFVSGQEEPASYERCERLHVGGDSCTSEKGHAGACTFGVAIEPKRVSGQEEPNG